MFGYVRPAAQRLSGEDSERFHSAYCGLCHTLEGRYGFAARFLLNFDFTFLAILLSLGTAVTSTCRRCVAHPCKGCGAMEASAALDTAADHSVVLAWWQIQDHIADHGFFTGLKYRLAALVVRKAYSKARTLAPEFDAAVQRHLSDLAARERERCTSLDAAAEPFAALLAEIAAAEPDEIRRRVFKQLFYHLGRWIYLIDAVDDFKADAASGNYNPLRYRFGVEGDTLPDEVKAAMAQTLDASIRQMAGAYALLDAGEWTRVLDSIFYDSLYGIGKAVLDGHYHRRYRMRRKRVTERQPV